MPDFVIILVVAVWIISMVNAIRKAIVRSQAQTQALQVRPAPGATYAGAVRPPPSQRGQALQQVARVIRAATAPAAPLTFAEATAIAQPPAPQLSMADMVAPSMPAFDAITLPADRLAATYSSASSWAGENRLLDLTADTNGSALAIVAAAVIGPPVGLRAGGGLAADW
ncbi:MAG: hypothetical protein JO219_03560 [Candidatus Eremiobacteraeota bacterium]|nr:hypothetical protein [Candidatus Eremiobacteraeota bacterium]